MSLELFIISFSKSTLFMFQAIFYSTILTLKKYRSHIPRGHFGDGHWDLGTFRYTSSSR